MPSLVTGVARLRRPSFVHKGSHEISAAQTQETGHHFAENLRERVQHNLLYARARAAKNRDKLPARRFPGPPAHPRHPELEEQLGFLLKAEDRQGFLVAQIYGEYFHPSIVVLGDQPELSWYQAVPRHLSHSRPGL